jgi:S-DNA-T family DNA segregation ATPase FtsK/SpoIIIE
MVRARFINADAATRHQNTTGALLPTKSRGADVSDWPALLLFDALRPAEGFFPQITVGALRWLFGLGAITVPALLCLLGVSLMVRRHHLNLRAFGRGAAAGTLVLLTGAHLAVPHGEEFATRAAIFSHGGYTGGAMAWALRSALGEIGAMIFLGALTLVAVLFWSEVSLAQVAGRVRDAVLSGVERVRPQQRESVWAEDEFDDEAYGDSAFEEEPVARGRQRNQLKPTRRLPHEIVQDTQGAAWEDLPSQSEMAPRNGAPPKTGRSPFLSVDELLAGTAGAPTEDVSPPAAPPTSTQLNADVAADVAAQPVAKAAPVAPDTAAPELPAVRIEITDAPPPQSVLETPIDVAPEPAKSEDEMTPVEKLEAQALASATGGEEVVKKPRIEKPRRRFGDGPLMPEYFDDAVRALDPPVTMDTTGVQDDVQVGVKAVQETLASFKIDARVTDVKRGPVITRYEVQPAPGVRVAAIANLDRDMARSLSAIAVRIEAPVPGKDVVGIEVPNKKVHLVRLRDVLERHDFLSTQSKLSFVLGKDIAGQPKWADLTKMPHMLIAGATNSGKSVCLNSIIASILVRATPEEVKFSLIDPKRVELTLYRDIPHLYHPVVVEPKDAVRALRGAIAEMDKRYKRFAERGVRNIASYNAKLEEGEPPLPYLVIVIDELADLMMTAAAEFEKLICRLAQLARATGIHLIVATQRPSVNVITGVIKANIPSRVAFAVASQVDSRTILDSVGAERLIGSGDMLFDANNGGKAVRIQGAFLSEEEVNRVVDVVKAHYGDDEPLDYGLDLDEVDDDGVLDEGGSSRSDEKRDDLYDEILEFVQRNTEMSASLIQRKFEIGYPRAGRIVDQLERDGVLLRLTAPSRAKLSARGVSRKRLRRVLDQHHFRIAAARDGQECSPDQWLHSGLGGRRHHRSKRWLRSAN